MGDESALRGWHVSTIDMLLMFLMFLVMIVVVGAIKTFRRVTRAF